jgi:SagB-type dehydrogenase family enzyme
MNKILLIPAFMIMLSACQEKPATISVNEQLPAPQISGGKPLMITLRDRKSTRKFSEKALDMQQISNLLWAANGINRPNDKRHTAPTARNKQEIDIYLAMKSGLFLFDADNQKLEKINDEDIRSQIGPQDFHKIAPVSLILVANYDKTEGADSTQKHFSAIDAGYISQNIYLYCSSENLATVAVAYMNYSVLEGKLKLNKNQQLMLAHPVGFPGE